MNLRHICAYVLLVMVGCVMAGCGYTNGVILPNGIKTIAVPTFKNELPMDTTYTYEAGLEIDVTNDIIDRLNYDGNLKLVSEDKNPDAILEGSIVSYDQDSVRYEDRRSIKEYRMFIGVDISLIDNRSGQVIWTEKGFTGKTEYFRTGTDAISERTASEKVRKDLAKKVVDRIVEDW